MEKSNSRAESATPPKRHPLQTINDQRYNWFAGLINKTENKIIRQRSKRTDAKFQDDQNNIFEIRSIKNRELFYDIGY